MIARPRRDWRGSWRGVAPDASPPPPEVLYTDFFGFLVIEALDLILLPFWEVFRAF